MTSLTTTAALTEIRQLCQRYSSSATAPGTHALAYRILGIMQRYGVLEQPDVIVKEPVKEPTDLNPTPAARMEANGKKEKERG